MVGFKLLQPAAELSYRLKTVTAGGTVRVGHWVVLAGDDGYYDEVADSPAVLSGLAMSEATVGNPLLVLVPVAGDVFEGPYIGSPAADDAGEQFELDVTTTVLSVNFGETTRKVLTILSYTATGATCKFTIIPSVVTPYGQAAI